MTTVSPKRLDLYELVMEKCIDKANIQILSVLALAILASLYQSKKIYA